MTQVGGCVAAYIGGVKFLVFLVLLALVVYALVRVAQQRGLRPPPRRPAAPPPRPHGPDDDPDFLRDLDRKRRQEEGGTGGPGGTGTGT
jgi:hypothetical protein